MSCMTLQPPRLALPISHQLDCELFRRRALPVGYSPSARVACTVPSWDRSTTCWPSENRVTPLRCDSAETAVLIGSGTHCVTAPTILICGIKAVFCPVICREQTSSVAPRAAGGRAAQMQIRALHVFEKVCLIIQKKITLIR